MSIADELEKLANLKDKGILDEEEFKKQKAKLLDKCKFFKFETNNVTNAGVNELSLWNPVVAALWSLLFSPIFGAWIHAKNWEEIGDKEKAEKTMYWVYGGVAVYVLVALFSETFGGLIALIYFFAWGLSPAVQQINYVKGKLKNDYKKRKWAKPLGMAVIGFFCYLLIIGSITQNNEVFRKNSDQGTSEINQNDEGNIPIVKIVDILSAYNENEVGADNKYKGQIIQVTGIVDSIKKDITDSLYVTLGTGKSFEIPQIQAFFDDSMDNQLGQLRKGQLITIVCRIQGLMMNVIAHECIIKEG